MQNIQEQRSNYSKLIRDPPKSVYHQSLSLNTRRTPLRPVGEEDILELDKIKSVPLEHLERGQRWDVDCDDW